MHFEMNNGIFPPKTIYIAKEDVAKISKDFKSLDELKKRVETNFANAYPAYWIDVFVDGKKIFSRQSLNL